MFIDPSGHWPDWNKLVQGAILATVGVLTVAAVVATGGAATAVVALGYAAVATAGTTLAIQGTAEVVESVTGKNPVRDDMGENLYDAVMNASLAVASLGEAAIEAGSNITIGNTNNLIKNEKSDSKVLRNNLIKANIKPPEYRNAAHHIVAGGSSYKAAEEARIILSNYGIGINDAVNGVFLPIEKGVSEAAYHCSLHTYEYYNAVLKLLQNTKTRNEAEKVLKEIANRLLDGTFGK